MHMLWVCVHAESMQIVHGSSHQQAMQKQTNDRASVASGMHMPLTHLQVQVQVQAHPHLQVRRGQSQLA